MLCIAPYDETVEWLRYADGYVVLLPNEWDIAAQSATIAELEQRLEDMEDEQPAPVIRGHLRIVDGFEKQQAVNDEGEIPSEAEYKRAKDAVREWEAIRDSEWRGVSLAIKNAYRQLERMENPTAVRTLKQRGKTDATAVQISPAEKSADIFVLRTFTHKEFVSVSDDHTTVDPESHTRHLDLNPRNIALLNMVLEGRRNDEGKVEKITKPEENLPDAVVKTLIGRMWARNSMNDQLVGYFRQRR